MSLGKRLKSERELRKWSQKYVAEKIGITNTVLSNYERDYRDPDTETLTKLTELYDVSADYILGKENKPTLDDGQNILPEEERKVLEELKKYPELFYDLTSNTEQKVKDLVHLQKMKQLLMKEIEQEQGTNKDQKNKDN